MKGNLQKLLFLCMIFFAISVGRIAAQENFASPVVIGELIGTYNCSNHYTDSRYSCSYGNDVGQPSADVVYSFTISTTATVEMSMCGSSFDTYIQLFDGGFSFVNSNDDSCGFQSYLNLVLTAGTYYIVCEGYSSDCGTYNLSVTANGAPVPDLPVLVDLNGDCSVDPVIPTATDDCLGTIYGVPDIPIPFNTTHTVVWTFNDGLGASSTQTQNVTINDVTPPVPDLLALPDITADCEILSFEVPTATDDCGYVTVTNDAVLPMSTNGTTIVTWNYEDGNGNFTTQTQNVIISNLPPVPDLPALADITAECEISSLVEPTATDDCGTVTVTNDAVLPITAQGTTVVTWYYEDIHSNIITQTQNVILADITDPVITPEDITIGVDPTTCSAALSHAYIYDIPFPQLLNMYSWGWNCNGTMDAYNGWNNVGISWTSTETEEPASISVEFYQTVMENSGPFNVSFNGQVANDYTGTQGYCNNQVVNIELNPADYILGGLNTVYVDVFDGNLCWDQYPAWTPGSYARVTVNYNNDPEVIDNCGIASLTNDVIAPLGIGSHTVTWTATDFVGNIVTAEQIVTVVDLSGPTPDLALLPDVTAECEVLTLPEPTASDNCGGLVTVTNDATLPYDADGLYVVTWTYTDENDNVTTQTQNVIVDDYTLPIPDLPALGGLDGDCFVNPIIPTATDNCSGVIDGVPDIDIPFTYSHVVTWTFDDGNGNVVTQTQNVTINDVTPPVPDVLTLTDVTGECSVTLIEAPTATDDCSGVVTGTTMISFPITDQGLTIVTWEFEDENGNLSSQNQNVVIQDVTNPEIEAPEDLLISTDPYACEMLTPLDTAVYYISFDDISYMGSPSGLGCNGTIDLYTCGGTAGLNWQSTETDEPVFVYVEIYQTYNQNSSDLPVYFNGISDSDYTGPDGFCSNDLVTVELSPESYIIGGVNTIDIQSLYECIVFDQNPDSEWEPESYARVIVGYPSIDEPVATDNCELVSLVNDVQASYPIGNHTITWTATDIAGNITTVEQNLVVADLAGPIADEAVLTDIISDCEITTLTEPTALDYCTGPVTGVSDVTLPITGTTTIHWTYTDANGNITVQEQNAIIEDNLAPVADVTELDDIIVSCEVTTLDVPTATDNCSGIINGVHDADLPLTEQGGNLVTWTYTDANGNVTTQFQVIIIMDYTGPVADEAELEDVFACSDVLTLTAPTATDECSGSIVGEHNATLPITESTIVTWSYTDNLGNVSYQDQQITITDVDETVNDNSPYLTSNQDDATYQWLDCDNSYAPIEGATSQTFLALVNGNYAVEVTFNGCTEISDCYNVTNVGISSQVSTANNVSAYPNPTSGMISIEMPLECETSWRLLDVTGQIVMEGNSSEQLFNLDIEDYTPGVYMLNLIQGENSTNLRIVRK